MKREKEASSLEKANVEEKSYHWLKAAHLYEKAAKSFFAKKMSEKAARTYKKLGYTYYWAGKTAESHQEYMKLNKCAVKAYTQAKNLFRQGRNKPEELECAAEALFAGVSSQLLLSKEKRYSAKLMNVSLNQATIITVRIIEKALREL